MGESYPQINSITKGPRDTNFELLRIIAMFMVLIVHADFYTLGGPSFTDFIDNPINSWARTLFQASSRGCVNIFVMISGWFGIRATLKGALSFLFQCFYFYFGILIVSFLLGYESINLHNFATCLCLNDTTGWFIKSYLALYILSPVLNKFLENSSKQQILFVLIAFYCLQTIYTFTKATPYIASGYSPFSFIGLYILARFIKSYLSGYYKWGG